MVAGKCVSVSLAQPANNARSNATVLAFPSGPVSGTNVNATLDGPATACMDITGARDVWYSFTVPTSGGVTVNMCAGASFDTALQVFQNLGGTLGAVVACDDDACGQFRSLIEFNATAGASYYVRAMGYQGNTGTFTLTVEPLAPLPPPVAQSEGPDVTIGDLSDVADYGTRTVGGVSLRGFAVGTNSWNIGDRDAVWYAGDTRHPVIGQQMYRLKDGKFEQIGMSWLKHGFFATNSGDFVAGMAFPSNDVRQCQPSTAGGAELGVNCSDLYSASLNGSRSYLGPRYDVNALTGAFTYPWQPLVNGYTPTGSNAVARRLQVRASDIAPAEGTRYFVDSIYVTPDDAQWNNSRNNYSARELAPTGPSTGTWGFAGATQRFKTALELWPSADSSVRLSTVEFHESSATVSDNGTPVTKELTGKFIVGSRAQDNGNGTWTYQYAVMNVNSHRALSGIALRTSGGLAFSAPTFQAPLYHDGDRVDNSPWLTSTNAGYVKWATNPTFPSTVTIPETSITLSGVQPNYVYYGTMYNYTVTSSAPPATGYLRLQLGRAPAIAGVGFQGSLLTATGVLVPTPCLADIAAPGQIIGPDGQLTADDIIVFINAFFAGDQLTADIAGAGQTLLPDGELTADDIIVFVNNLFAGC